VRGMVLALALAGCAHAREGPRLVLAAPARASARVGAARLELWIANEGAAERRVAADADALEVAVTSTSGEAVRCRAASGGGTERLLAPGDRVHVQLDLSRRCDLGEPGEYRVEVRHPAGMNRTVALLLTRWVNPGPIRQAPPRP
jgi:hypothetical protein